ncbi:hypothetical protein [Pseudogemmobacter sonorensis]|uniref:hypothetical protein n=1 Tax=Pseudogemmobacter sonorensis TaxID=2989681 RepID=UPI00369572A3
MRRLSLNARLAQDAETGPEIYVVLFHIEHEDMAAPIRLSTDNTERISSDPDLIYGTRSSWRGADPGLEPFLWIIASAVLPSDLEDTPAAAKVVLENLDRELARLLRSFTTPATIHMAVVLADTPNLIEQEYAGLQLVSADMDAGEIAIAFSREEIELEYYPAGRMTRNRFPGLHL